MKILSLLILTPFIALAHGEDKEGPHGGHIRMPGAFHTELMLDEKQEAHIFLLDMEFKYPTVKNSKIEVAAVNGKDKVDFKCSVMGGNHFHCVPTKKYPLKGELKVKAVRDGAVGNEVSYKLPLTKLAEEKPSSAHDHH
ncbi:hypothetical protein AZI85_08810 [Bdellovibrio bacteriovorus]|uniref:Uncharacterized protein n=1 Tax=Bdellovibrio bacteriovorus TaxID=959 RepID=A0A150WDT3_BDEBC|nr:hypothetical protein [Bdellovibrio bacteriovorus]KYG61050.1 hypothetical protein AZI85_08810 [Bdellovibrio bacteriovorus]